MKTLKQFRIAILCFAIAMTGCQKNEISEKEEMDQVGLDTNRISDAAAYKIQFWEQHPDPTEEELIEHYEKLDEFVNTLEVADPDLSVLYKNYGSNNGPQEKLIGSTIFSSVVGWGVGKGLDKLFNQGNSTGSGETNFTLNSTDAVNRIITFLENDYEKIINDVGDIVVNTKIADGRAKVLNAQSSLLKGISADEFGNGSGKTDFKNARDLLSAAMGDYLTALPNSINQFVPALGLLTEANRRLSNSPKKFGTNMNRVQIEAKVILDAINNLSAIDIDQAIGFAGSRDIYDQIFTALSYQSLLFEGGRTMITKQFVRIAGIKAFGGFLLAVNHPEFNNPEANSLMRFAYASREDLVRFHDFSLSIFTDQTTGNFESNTLNIAESVDFDPTPFRYLTYQERTPVSADQKFFIVPYGGESAYIMVTTTNITNATRTLELYTDIYGVESFERIDGSQFDLDFLTITTAKGRVLR